MKIITAERILKANDQAAAENRRQFTNDRVYVVNLVGSPGCGKTALLEALFTHLRGHASPAVVEGDIAGQIDAERVAKMGVPVIQINTEGMCHLDANMIGVAVAEMDSRSMDMLWIENVGNLVCTAGYDLGEHLRIVVLSVSEGDDKLVKYPAIFQRSDALVVTKMDLLPHTNFDAARVRGDMRRLAPDAAVFEVSAAKGDGITDFVGWLLERKDAATQ